jgi:flagellar biosynthesis/type III secretory pathway protein FliH
MTATHRTLSWFEKREVTTEDARFGMSRRGDESRSTETNAIEVPEVDVAPSAPPSAPPPPPPSPSPSPELEALHAAERALTEREAELERARTEAEETRALLTRMRSELDEANDAIRRLATNLHEDAERELVKLALAVADRVVARELSIAPELVVDWAREAIASSTFGEHLQIALSTELASALEGADWGDMAPFVSLDPALHHATCEVRDGGRVITVDAGTRLGLVGDHLATVAESEAA